MHATFFMKAEHVILSQLLTINAYFQPDLYKVAGSGTS